MKSRAVIATCAGAVFGCSMAALGQSFVTVPLTNAAADGDAYDETSIAVSRTNPNHFIVACNFQKPPYVTGPFRRVYYGISTSAMAWSQWGNLPTPPAYASTEEQSWQWFDPMTTASPTTDQLWVGCVFRPLPPAVAGFAVWQNPAGAGTLSVSNPGVIAPVTWKEDKGMMAVGPDRGNAGAETMYLGFTRTNYSGGPSDDILMWRKSADGAPGLGWTPEERRILPGIAEPEPRVGFGAMPVVLPAGAGADAGRLVMVYERAAGGFSHSTMVTIEVCQNQKPELSEDGHWRDAWVLDREYGFGNTQIFPVESVSAFDGPLAVGLHPSICRHPNEPRTVFVAFLGSATPYTFSPGDDQNTDIYIAKSTNGGVTFPQVQRITDAMLGDIGPNGLYGEGSDQFFPAITVDGYGGLNVAYLRMPHGAYEYANPPIDVCYVRIPQFPVPTGTQLTTHRLTPTFLAIPTGSLFPRVGDYISIDSSGCLVYIAYPKVEPAFPDRSNVYVTRVDVCAADIDSTGIVDINDVAAFAGEFSQGTQRTDMNSDGTHNATDVECFLNAYTCGCA